MKKHKPDFFWISYSDLMTSLFFIMLVLFVLAKVEWNKKESELEQAKRDAIKNYEQLEQLSQSTKEVEGEYFEYNPQNRSFKLKADTITFRTASAEFSPSAATHLVRAGKELAKKIKELEDKYKDRDVSYTIILEGMSSCDKNICNTFENYKYSYERAWRVKQLWDDNNIKFGNKTEIQISGTGVNGLGMVTPKNSIANQKVLIHVIPKIGKFQVER